MTQRDPHPDNKLIDEMAEESLGAGAQQDRSGGNLARNIATQDEEQTAGGGDPEPTRVNKSDKPNQGASPNPRDGTDLG